KIFFINLHEKKEKLKKRGKFKMFITHDNRELKLREITIEDEMLLVSFPSTAEGDGIAMELLFGDKFCYVPECNIGYLYFNGKQWTNEILDSIFFTAVVKMIQLRKKLGFKYENE